MFNKLVAIEPVSLIPSAEAKLHTYAHHIVMFNDIPTDDAEIIKRIGDADAVLLSYTSRITADIIRQCPNIRYIGMCCSLYSEESANVDIVSARQHNITVTGIRDYGDQGVVDYVLSELLRYLHGFGEKQWKKEAVELTSINAGVIGLGTSGRMIADTLSLLGANVSYYSRTRKPEAEQSGIAYKPLAVLLANSDVVFTCLNKNVYLLHEAEFKQLGNHKILFNTSIAPSHDYEALRNWLAEGSNEFFCDTASALDLEGRLLDHPHVNCVNKSAGRTREAFVRLSEKVLHNIADYTAKC